MGMARSTDVGCPCSEVGQLTAVSECDLCAVAPKAFGDIVALVRPRRGVGWTLDPLETML